MESISIEDLTEILKTMDVPPFRFNDLNWLSRNLGIRNADHANFPVAKQMIKDLLLQKKG